MNSAEKRDLHVRRKPTAARMKYIRLKIPIACLLASPNADKPIPRSAGNVGLIVPRRISVDASECTRLGSPSKAPAYDVLRLCNRPARDRMAQLDMFRRLDADEMERSESTTPRGWCRLLQQRLIGGVCNWMDGSGCLLSSRRFGVMQRRCGARAAARLRK